MQNLLDAVAEFEPGFVLERAQLAQVDVREFERVPGLRVENWV